MVDVEWVVTVVVVLTQYKPTDVGAVVIGVARAVRDTLSMAPDLYWACRDKAFARERMRLRHAAERPPTPPRERKPRDPAGPRGEDEGADP
ncbi:MAG: hypothetical protein H6733_10275 [Alphaproteobacteria bacterium]|nr:hypothetical protein [Alphaproteobacteria bacterium]